MNKAIPNTRKFFINKFAFWQALDANPEIKDSTLKALKDLKITVVKDLKVTTVPGIEGVYCKFVFEERLKETGITILCNYDVSVPKKALETLLKEYIIKNEKLRVGANIDWVTIELKLTDNTATNIIATMELEERIEESDAYK